jgi:hypothetical protein
MESTPAVAKRHSRLSKDAVRSMLETKSDEKQTSVILQALNVKEFESDPEQKKKAVKLRFNISDGVSQVLAMMNKQVYDKMVSYHLPITSLGRTIKLIASVSLKYLLT